MWALPTFLARPALIFQVDATSCLSLVLERLPALRGVHRFSQLSEISSCRPGRPRRTPVHRRPLSAYRYRTEFPQLGEIPFCGSRRARRTPITHPPKTAGRPPISAVMCACDEWAVRIIPISSIGAEYVRMVIGTRNKLRSASPLVGDRVLHRDLYPMELELVVPEASHSRRKLERLLHPQYKETGSTGNLYDRETTIEMMLAERPGGVVVRDFQAQLMAPDTALVTYRSIGGGGQEARRTSIWMRTDKGWQLRFHQGTRIPNHWGNIS